MIPAWLTRARGDVYRAARLHPCSRCGAPILSGLDADIAARTAHADPTPITPLGETIALLAGRTTYDLTTTYGRRELCYRDQWNIQGSRKHPVLPEHKCGYPLTEHAETIPTKPRYISPENPPF